MITLTREQKKKLRGLIEIYGRVNTERERRIFLDDAGLLLLEGKLNLQGTAYSFAYDLLQECILLGAPPELEEEATILLLKHLRDVLRGQQDEAYFIDMILELYIPKSNSKSEIRDSNRKISNSITYQSIDSNNAKTELRRIVACFASPTDKPVYVDHERDILRDILADYDYYECKATKTSLLKSLDSKHPSFLHYGGSSTEEGLILENENRLLELIPWKPFGELLSNYRDTLELIFLNGCNTAAPAFLAGLGHPRPIIIGATGTITDRDATNFAERFYTHLTKFGDSYKAFTLACNYLALSGSECRYKYINPEDSLQ